MKKVLVYGSLKKGLPLHRLLQKSKFLGYYTTHYQTYNMASYGDFPVVYNGGFRINGELYEVDPGTMRALDAAEHVPELYQRIRIPLLEYEGFVEMYVAGRRLRKELGGEDKFSSFDFQDPRIQYLKTVNAKSWNP